MNRTEAKDACLKDSLLFLLMLLLLEVVGNFRVFVVCVAFTIKAFGIYNDCKSYIDITILLENNLGSYDSLYDIM